MGAVGRVSLNHPFKNDLLVKQAETLKIRLHLLTRHAERFKSGVLIAGICRISRGIGRRQTSKRVRPPRSCGR